MIQKRTRHVYFYGVTRFLFLKSSATLSQKISLFKFADGKKTTYKGHVFFPFVLFQMTAYLMRHINEPIDIYWPLRGKSYWSENAQMNHLELSNQNLNYFCTAWTQVLSICFNLPVMASSALNHIKPIRKRRFNSPNDHIISLIKEWYNDAKANGAQTVHCYRKVLEVFDDYITFPSNDAYGFLFL